MNNGMRLWQVAVSFLIILNNVLMLPELKETSYFMHIVVFICMVLLIVGLTMSDERWIEKKKK